MDNRSIWVEAYRIKQKSGTLEGLIEGLAALGFEIEIDESFMGTEMWSHFLITVTGWDGTFSEEEFFQKVRDLKPAHTLPVYDCTIAFQTWDDWEIGEEERPLDEGVYDEWISDSES